MTSANPSSTTALDPGTTSWQPETIAERQSAISDFLDGQFTIPVVREAAERTLRLLDLPSGGAVLDVGCGTGIIVTVLIETAILVQSGLDLPPVGDHLVSSRILTRARADAATTWITEAEASGRFFAAGPYVTVAGRVPARTTA
jgi:hypothetical protein